MKENELKKILETPVMDEAMDQKIANSLLLHKTNERKDPFLVGWKQVGFLLSQRAMFLRISKLAILLITLVIIGTGTVLAAGLYVKSLPSEVSVKTMDMIDEDGSIVIKGKNEVKKRFGKGSKKVSLLRDRNGKILEIGEDGYYTFEDGSKFLAPYIPDPKRHENDLRSADQAFAEMEFPNLIPTILFKDYVLDENGFYYYEASYEDKVRKSLYGGFFPDYIISDNFNETVYFEFTPIDSMDEKPGVIHLVDREQDIRNYIQSSYTNQSGIICTLLESKINSNIIAHITFESDTIGNGRIMIEFINFQMDRIEEILDSIPITSDIVKTIE